MLGKDDAGFFAFEFMGARELAAQELDKAARARAAVGAQKAHAIEKDEELENLGILRVAKGRLRRGLLGFGEKSGKGIVQGALDRRNGRLFVEDARREGPPCFGK